MTEDPLQDLVAAALEGQRAALDELCRELSGPVYRLSLRMLGHSHDAEDATQEILIQVVTHLSQFRRESRVLTWAYTIATRHLLRRRRGRREKDTRIESVAQMIDLGLSVTSPTSEPRGEARVLAREVGLACTQQMLLALSREERVAVLLADVLGATDAVGAEICETTREVFRKRLSRARAKLRPVLEERCGLRDAALPCSCTRQAAAKQQHRADARPRWTSLPVVDDAQVARARDQLAAVQRMGGVFAMQPPPAPPTELWRQIASMLPDLAGDGSRFQP